MPGLDEILFRGSGAEQTHYSMGADEATYTDDFSWGYLMRVTADYNNNALLGCKWAPGFTFYHDVDGTSISPGQDFGGERKDLTLSTDILFTNEFCANLQYRFY